MKKFLIGFSAVALCALNLLAFSAIAKPEPQLPIEFEGCYQTVSSCDNYGVQRENCTSRKTNHKCTRNYYKCHNCNNAPVIVPIDPIFDDPIVVGPIRPFDPIDGPIRPIDPVEPIIIVSPY